ncbi:hypothetical protein EVAR_25870_1 [Eumeta japonica]|uniref:Uncharacterized protein n=1 Tax=Eumeta variegata TaxID=151549 RepID=A0A4C1X987_EUMVA|nr:hypothetical protein EVAR_25870_1 [Eumeta japonica]
MLTRSPGGHLSSLITGSTATQKQGRTPVKVGKRTCELPQREMEYPEEEGMDHLKFEKEIGYLMGGGVYHG